MLDTLRPNTPFARGPCAEFIAFYHLLAAREEMNEVFYDYSNRSPTLDPRQLRTFILVEQKVGCAGDHAWWHPKRGGGWFGG